LINVMFVSSFGDVFEKSINNSHTTINSSIPC
jgi:hypothetical protein